MFVLYVYAYGCICNTYVVALGFGPHLLPCLRPGLLFTVAYARLDSGDSPVPVSHLHTGTAEAHPTTSHFYIDLGDLTCVART